MYAKYGKRTLDVAGGTLALTILIIPLAFVVVWIRIDSKGPALFRQKRYGQHKKPFTVYKFRSMATHAPDDIATNDFHDSHAYITSCGRIMRKLSIDELPQLINVIKGDMSLVGPRPVVLKEERITKLRDSYGANALKPGITGWAQVNGRDALNNTVKSRLDGEYVRGLSFKMDMKCLVMTIWAVVAVKGHQEGHELASDANNNADAILVDSHPVTDESWVYDQ